MDQVLSGETQSIAARLSSDGDSERITPTITTADFCSDRYPIERVERGELRIAPVMVVKVGRCMRNLRVSC
jgi:hypothetical protein